MLARALQHADVGDVGAEVHDEDLGVLAGTDDAAIVALGAEDPTGVPAGEAQDLLAGLHVEHLDVGVVAAADEATAYTVNV